ncbi:MAG TPA: RsmE family RNA methyltransferase [Sediminispirochaeta sp.]|nr:RsmE family RNA methyltransferase [Sediminispirochaeta sp.]
MCLSFGTACPPPVSVPPPPTVPRKMKQKKSSLGLFFHQSPLAQASLHEYLSSEPRRIGLCIGPEGGFSKGETEYLRQQGFSPVHLHTNVLRAETAAVYAIGAVQTIFLEREKWQTR